MDPTATVTRYIDAINEGDYWEAIAAGDDLYEWVARDGFLNKGDALRVILGLIHRTVEIAEYRKDTTV